MKKYWLQILFTCWFYIACLTHAFSQGSFYIDSTIQSVSSRVAFSDDAIYFYNDSYLVKTNYSGTKIWSRDNLFSKLIAAGSSLYGIRQDSLIKMDTAGNLVWIKKFANPICPAVNNSNYFTEIVFDGNQLYLHELQEQGQGYSAVHPATLVVDTTGNILFTRCDSIYTQLRPYHLSAGCASTMGGAIFSYGMSGGNYYYSYAQHENPNGTLNLADTFPIFHVASQDAIWQIIPTPDSSYFILSNAQYYQPAQGVVGVFTVVKVTENGSIMWKHSVYDNANIPLSNYKYADGVGIATDDSNQVYIVGSASTNFGYRGFFATKFDANGNILFTKFWHDTNLIKFDVGYGPFYFCQNTLHYQNDSLYCLARCQVNGNNCKPAIMVFDKQFTNICYPEDSTLSMADYWSSIGPGTLPRWSYNSLYVPVDDSLTFVNVSVVEQDLCLAIGSGKEIEFLELKVFPNPTSGKFKIEWPDSKRNIHLLIYNSMGQKITVQSKTINHEIQIDLSNNPTGIYFIQAFSGNKIFNGKVIKE
jgi:hypothetical protein